MKRLNEILQELGVSKVKLAKYLGVSRQMVYNYLVLDSLDKLPKEKKLLLLQLLDIENGSEEDLNNLVVNKDLMAAVEKKLNSANKKNRNDNFIIESEKITKDNKALLNNIMFLLKERLEEDATESTSTMLRYLYYLLQSIENIPEIEYILAYIAKSNSFIAPDEFAFDEDKQFTFEGILYTAMSLYNSGKADKDKVISNHRLFVQEIELKNEEKLGRTQQLMTISTQALKELGYKTVTPENAVEFYEKMAEIESRKV